MSFEVLVVAFFSCIFICLIKNLKTHVSNFNVGLKKLNPTSFNCYAISHDLFPDTSIQVLLKNAQQSIDKKVNKRLYLRKFKSYMVAYLMTSIEHGTSLAIALPVAINTTFFCLSLVHCKYISGKEQL